MVPDIFVSGFPVVFNHPIFCPVFKCTTSLDHFMYEESYKMFFFCTKWSNLADYSKARYKCPVFEWLWQPSCFNHSKNEPDISPAKLDHFIQNKNVIIIYLSNGLD
jgi:hypothetical protein